MQWNGVEVGRTNIKRNTSWPQWDGDPQNVFVLPLEKPSKGTRARDWRRTYRPSVKVEVYDMIVNEENIPAKGQLHDPESYRLAA